MLDKGSRGRKGTASMFWLFSQVEIREVCSLSVHLTEATLPGLSDIVEDGNYGRTCGYSTDFPDTIMGGAVAELNIESFLGVSLRQAGIERLGILLQHLLLVCKCTKSHGGVKDDVSPLTAAGI